METIAVILIGVMGAITAVNLWKSHEMISGMLRFQKSKRVASGDTETGIGSKAGTVMVSLSKEQVRSIRHCLDSEARCYDALLAERGPSMSETERTKAFSEAARHREMARRLAMAAESAKIEPDLVFDLSDENHGRQGS